MKSFFFKKKKTLTKAYSPQFSKAVYCWKVWMKEAGILTYCLMQETSQKTENKCQDKYGNKHQVSSERCFHSFRLFHVVVPGLFDWKSRAPLIAQESSPSAVHHFTHF